MLLTLHHPSCVVQFNFPRHHTLAREVRQARLAANKAAAHGMGNAGPGDAGAAGEGPQQGQPSAGADAAHNGYGAGPSELAGNAGGDAGPSRITAAPTGPKRYTFSARQLWDALPLTLACQVRQKLQCN